MTQKSLLNLSDTAKSIVVGGFYEHYKKFRYRVLAIARHSESLEEMVAYQALYGDSEVWIRPLSIFVVNILFDGKLQPRLAFA
jgi:hypothetical protein